MAVPFWDDFKTAKDLCRAVDNGGWTWADWFSQDNESRPVFPRIVFLAAARWSRWDQRWVMACTWGVLVSTALVLHGLARQTLRGKAAAAVSLLATVEILRISQWQDLLWAHQFMLVVPAAALALGLFVQNLRWRLLVRSLISSAVGFVATFSFANGMALWVLFPVGMLLAPSRQIGEREVSGRRLAALVVLFAGVASLTLYFHGYAPPDHHPTLIVSDIARLAQFSFGFIGEGLCPWTGRATAVAAGLIGAVAWAACCVTLVRSWRRNYGDRGAAAVPWLLFSAYSLISASVTAVGRLSFGMQEFAESRYFTIAIPFWVGLLPAVYLACRSYCRPQSRLPARTATAFGAVIVLLVALDLVRAWGAGAKYAQDRRAEQMICSFSPVVFDEANARHFVWNHGDVSQSVAILAELGKLKLLHFPLRTEKFAQDYFPRPAPSEHPIGRFEQLTPTDTGRWRATGWAAWPASRKRVDAILIAAVQPDGRSRLIAVTGETFLPRPRSSGTDFAIPTNCGWAAGFDPAKLPGGPLIPGTVLQAYAYDPVAGTLQVITGEHEAP